MKRLTNYIKSLGWSKEDVKKIIMFVIMLLIACLILNKFLKIRVCGDIDVGNYNGTSLDVRADVNDVSYPK